MNVADKKEGSARLTARGLAPHHAGRVNDLHYVTRAGWRKDNKPVKETSNAESSLPSAGLEWLLRG
jgi:hypothetical protein